MGGKLAVVEGRIDDRGYHRWRLIVGGVVVDQVVHRDDADEMQSKADRINAAVDAEVERRLDEITKGAC